MLNSTTPIVNHPWAILGDFNQIIRSVHHSNSQDLEVDVSGMENLNLATQKAEIFEAQYKGLSFTWWNNQEATPISKKINHAFINQEWANKFPDGFAEFLEPHQSDHAPWPFRLPSAQRRVPKPFKFFNHIVDHPLFEDTVRAAWHPEEIIGICLFKLVRSLKLLEKELRRINKTHYSGISQRVKDQGEIVSQLQRRLLTQPGPQPAVQEHEARAKWQILAKAEEKFYHQRFRVQWYDLGDRSTTFYHKTVDQRAAQNHIHSCRWILDKRY
ncbi:hypothetical protein F2Q69_00005071 [Brassica cretica]|uniref:Uncharacterized protein n=1 Tax=Brassica cretica TaxID=69181 RepID=A0A8S9P693_BRACR|nr:hypothetical protein F2Q69_00005071 [Brassica cretica]